VIFKKKERKKIPNDAPQASMHMRPRDDGGDGNGDCAGEKK
jgi:hypothetical protein